MSSVGNKVLFINIGGLRYETTEATIRRIQDTRLTQALDENPNTEIFIDRDAKYFAYVLNYLRNGSIQVDDTDCDDLFDIIEKEAQCIIDKNISIPFTYERNSYFYAKCIACDASFDPKCSNVYGVIVDEWAALGHHMRFMTGKIEKVLGNTCVVVRWDNGVSIHLPNTAVKRNFSVNYSEKCER